MSKDQKVIKPKQRTPENPNLVAVLIICEKHEVFALRECSSGQWLDWIPFDKVDHEQPWYESCLLLLEGLLPGESYSNPVVVHILHKKHMNRWTKRVIFKSTVGFNGRRPKVKSVAPAAPVSETRSSESSSTSTSPVREFTDSPNNSMESLGFDEGTPAQEVLPDGMNEGFVDLKPRAGVEDVSFASETSESDEQKECPCQKKHKELKWVPMKNLLHVMDNPKVWGKKAAEAYPFSGVDLSRSDPPVVFYDYISRKNWKKQQKAEDDAVTGVEYRFGLCERHSLNIEFIVYPRIIELNLNGEIESTTIIPDEYTPGVTRHVVNLSNEIFGPDPKSNKSIISMHTPVNRMIQLVKDHHHYITENHPKILGFMNVFSSIPLLHLKGSIKSNNNNHTNSNQHVPWYESNYMTQIVSDVESVLRRGKEILESESKILHLQSPLHVFGDIHGNLKDLIVYSSHILKPYPSLQSSGNCLFLGDYVDRGTESVEVVLYLLCKKIINPTKVYLLRGNHEDRSVQLNFTFKREVEKKFTRRGLNIDTANRIWNLFNDVFDIMPIAAVIDESIYTAHGGIPYTETNLDRLEPKIPHVMSRINDDSDSVWEILWSDPSTDKQHLEIQKMLQKPRDVNSMEQFFRGYIENNKRGTAYLYSQVAVDNFFHENDLTHMIRAHEVIKDGFVSHFGGKCFTVFSSSKYQGLNNKSACIFLNDSKLRPIQFET